MDGDCGPIWTSVNGGGLGRRGELDGETPAAVMARGVEIKRECEKEGEKEAGPVAGLEGAKENRDSRSVLLMGRQQPS